ncbi:hypothetical protein CR513_20091, partial [Mucuna pruriens]
MEMKQGVGNKRRYMYRSANRPGGQPREVASSRVLLGGRFPLFLFWISETRTLAPTVGLGEILPDVRKVESPDARCGSGPDLNAEIYGARRMCRSVMSKLPHRCEVDSLGSVTR